MSTFVLRREYALQLPNSYVDVDRDEMEYVDGGFALPKWLVAGAINLAVSALVGGSLTAARGFFTNLAGRYGRQAAATIFSRELKNKLIAKGVAATAASWVCGIASIGFTVLTWAYDPGAALANFIDANDTYGTNEWIG
ncbi:MAG: hypothetical protein KHZ99_18685 [Clostridium sp.]|uniref:hypothetical protein n=1 Tax=Clostridium TaxID=1485 RepID=UPI001159F6A4|nr:hypothetical protein [Clostridium sp.]MBS4959027.1 hypothetical protein [Clostridium sp.]MDU2158857.1 hypothetical protein [Clostridium sp.]